MTSNINPETINTDFPIANTDNLSQGFRDNFVAIQAALETAAAEISRLQNLQLSLNGVAQSATLSLGDGTHPVVIETNFAPSDLANSVEFPGTGAVRLPVGDTSQRPASAPLAPSLGMIRFNSDINNLEYYHGSSWVAVQTVGGTGNGPTGPVGPAGPSGNGGTGSASPAGPNQSIQFNDGGVLGGSTGFRWDGNQAIADQLLAGQVQINNDTITNILESGVLNLNAQGNINLLTVGSAGSGYVQIPAITIDPPLNPGGIQATALAHMGAVMAVPYARGSGYVPGDTLTVAGGVGSQSTILQVDTVRIKNNPMVDGNNLGSGYKPNDLLTVDGGEGPSMATLLVTQVQLILPQIVSSGFGYITGDIVGVFGGVGTEIATVSVTADPVLINTVFTADGVLSSFTLGIAPSTSQMSSLQVTLDGVPQTLNRDFTVVGNGLRFVSAPAINTTVGVILGGNVVGVEMIQGGSYEVLPNLLANPAVMALPASPAAQQRVGLVIQYNTAILAVQIQNQGPYYSLPENMLLNQASGGSGSGARFVLTSEINGFSILNAGDYSTLLPVLLNNPVEGGSGSGATVNLSYGLVSASIENAGVGYTQTPSAVVDASPSGNTAKIKPSMTGARVSIGDLFVTGKSIGTAPRVTNNLWVTVDGNDANDGTAEDRAFRTIKAACAVAEAYTTIFVRSGNYTEQNPIFIPPTVSIIGDNLRRVNLYYGNPAQDFFWVNNACYISGVSFRGGQEPGYAISFPPTGAGKITTSPYIQNCTCFNSTGGGMRVDGNLAAGLKSMVLDGFTQFNQGGHGVFITNQGYAQLVSIFTICCDVGTLVENGGTCSVNNSNTSFGNIGVQADGISPLLFTGSIVPGTTTVNSSLLNIENSSQRPYMGLVATVGGEFCYVNSVDILDQGVGYTSPPSLVFDSPEGYALSQATAEAVVQNGGIVGLTVTESGSGYTGNATVSISDISGSGASVGYVIYTAQNVPSILNGGSGYNVGDIITVQGGSYVVPNVTPVLLTVEAVNQGGTVTVIGMSSSGYYTDLPPVSGAITTSSGVGTGFSCSILFGIQEIVLASRGTGYTMPQVYISGAGGVVALGTCDIDPLTGTIQDVNIISQGGGYVSQPEIAILGGSGTSSAITGASAVSVVENGSVVGVRITNPGSNFVLDPVFSFTGGGGSGARVGAIQYQAVMASVAKNTTTTLNTLINGGSGYKINDLLVVDGGVVAAGALPTRVVVTAVSNDGEGSVVAIALDRAGLYSGMPSINGAPTSADISLPSYQQSSGTGCLVTLSMGLGKIVMASGGNGYLAGPRVRFIGGGAQSASVTAGQAYWNGGAQIIQSSETLTQHAIEYTKQLCEVLATDPASIPTNGVTGTQYQTAVSPVYDIALPSVPSTVYGSVSTFFDQISSLLTSGPSIAAIDNASNMLRLNRAFLQAEVLAFVNASYPGLLDANQQALCVRDTGTIIDALAVDCGVGGYVRSMRAALKFWNGQSSVIANDQTQCVASLEYLRALASVLIANPSSFVIASYAGYPYQTSVLPSVNQPGLNGGAAAQANLNTAMAVIEYIILNGTNIQGFETASRMLRVNQAYIQAEVLAYVLTQNSSLTDVEQAVCAANIGALVEAVATDIMAGGGVPAQAQVELYPSYYTVNSSTPVVNNGVTNTIQPSASSLSARCGEFYYTSGVIEGEQTQTIVAINYLTTMVEKIVAQHAVTTIQSTASQTFDSSLTIDSVSLTTVDAAVLALTGVILSYIGSGSPVAQAGFAQAQSLLQQNMPFLGAEIEAFVLSQYPSLLAGTANPSYCIRDVGLLTSAVIQDIAAGGFANSINAGRCYWSASNSEIPGQLTAMLAALSYLSDLCVSVIQNTPVSTSLYQQGVVQHIITSGLVANYTLEFAPIAVNMVTAAFGIIAMAIENQGAILSMTNAATALRENKAFAQAQVGAWVAATYPGFLTSQQLQSCARDVGYILDAIAGDFVGAGASPLGNLISGSCVLTIDETLPYVPLDNEIINFYQVSMASISSHQFEFVGAGTDINTCLPSLGGVPIQANEVVNTNGGRVYYTSTDQKGDFRIGQGLVINQNSGTLTGRTFEKSLFGLITPFILSIESN